MVFPGRSFSWASCGNSANKFRPYFIENRISHTAAVRSSPQVSSPRMGLTLFMTIKDHRMRKWLMARFKTSIRVIHHVSLFCSKTFWEYTKGNYSWFKAKMKAGASIAILISFSIFSMHRIMHAYEVTHPTWIKIVSNGFQSVRQVWSLQWTLLELK